MKRIIATIEGEEIWEHEDGSITWRAKMAIDSDGIGPHHGDHTAQDDTSLHIDGHPLNADIDRYIVVPPAILMGVPEIVLGCEAHCHNIRNGMEAEGVVGDIGPRRKLGEASCAMASALGLNPSPVNGGTDDHIIEYRIFPGIPAVGYRLQPA